MLLIIGEATQQALLGDDFSIVNACVVICTLVTLDIVISRLETRCRSFGRVVGSLPVVVVETASCWRTARGGRRDASEILAEGREKHGLERLEQFKYAILERHGGISVIPTRTHDEELADGRLVECQITN